MQEIRHPCLIFKNKFCTCRLKDTLAKEQHLRIVEALMETGMSKMEAMMAYCNGDYYKILFASPDEIVNACDLSPIRRIKVK